MLCFKANVVIIFAFVETICSVYFSKVVIIFTVHVIERSLNMFVPHQLRRVRLRALN